MRQPPIPEIPTGFDGRDPRELDRQWRDFETALQRLTNSDHSRRGNPAVPYIIPSPIIAPPAPRSGWLARAKDQYHRHKQARRINAASRDISDLDNEIDAFKVYAADFRIEFEERLMRLVYAHRDEEYKQALENLLTPYEAFGHVGYRINCTPDSLNQLEACLPAMQSRIAHYLKTQAVDNEAMLQRLRYTRLENEEIDFIDAYTAVVKALPEMKAHPFIAAMLPQIPVLEAKMEQRRKAIKSGAAKEWNATQKPRADWLAALQSQKPQPEPLDLSTLDAEVTTLHANAKDFQDRFIRDSTEGGGYTDKILGRAQFKFSNAGYGKPEAESFYELGKLIQKLEWNASKAHQQRSGFDELPDALFERIRVQLEDIKPYFVKFFLDARIHDAASYEAARQKNEHKKTHGEGDSRFDLLDTYMEFIKALPEIEQHPFITESAPQIPLINAKFKQRHAIERAEAEGRDQALQGPRAQFLQRLLAQEGSTPQLGFKEPSERNSGGRE